MPLHPIKVAKELSARKHLHKVLGNGNNVQQCNLPQPFQFSLQPTILDSLTRLLSTHAWNCLTSSPDFCSLMDSTIQCRELVMESSTTDPAKTNLIMGATMPETFAYTGPKQILKNPDDGTVLLIKIPTAPGRKMDYIIMDCLTNFTAQDEIGYAQLETDSFRNMTTGKRCGPAGGHWMPNTDSLPSSCTPVTQQPGTMVSCHPTNPHTNTAVHYYNEGVKNYQQIYPDLFMRRLTKTQKKSETKSNPPARRKPLSEMKSRFTAMVILCRDGLESPVVAWKSLIAATESICARNSHVRKFWKAIDPGLTDWELVLLQWGCSTGEMRNHQPVAAHVDKNKSHVLESMTLHGKLPKGKCSDVPGTFRRMKPGQLYLPFQMFALQMRCGMDDVHLSLASTMHLADWHCGSVNWTSVHGL